MYFIWEKHTKHTVFDKHVSECLRIMCDIYAILDFKTDEHQTPQFLSEAACDELRSLIDIYLAHNSYLSSVCLASDPPLDLFHAVSKHHAMWHIGFEAQFGHPSSARTYLNEDFMQHIKEVGEACRYNVNAVNRSQIVAERFALGKCLELQIKSLDRTAQRQRNSPSFTCTQPPPFAVCVRGNKEKTHAALCVTHPLPIAMSRHNHPPYTDRIHCHVLGVCNHMDCRYIGQRH